jgi:hypothetical protein
LIVALLAVIAVCLLVQVPAATRTAQAQTAAAGAGNERILAVAGQITRETYGLYLVDTESGTVSLYEYAPGRPAATLYLRAARYYRYDLELDEYNTAPSPREIKKRTESPMARLRDVPPAGE